MQAVYIHRSEWQLQQLPIAGPLFGVLFDSHMHGRPAVVEFTGIYHLTRTDKQLCRVAIVIVRVQVAIRAIRTCAVRRRVRALFTGVIWGELGPHWNSTLFVKNTFIV
jgi:hypothetical protein